MKSIKYLFLALSCCLLLQCKKSTTDVLPPEVITGAYFPNTQMVKGGIAKHSEHNMTIYGHVWDTFPTPKLDDSPFKSVESYSGYNRDTLEVITPVEFMEGKTYYIRGYAKDTNDSIFYGEHEISYNPSDPANNPIACFANSADQCEAGNCTINFDADCSIPESFIVKYKWDIDGDGFTDYSGADEQNITHTYDVPGTYNVKLEVITSTGIGDDTIRTIQVGESSDMLVACFNMSKTECDIDNCNINFDASCSQNAVEYKWDFDGDGVSNDDEAITNHTYTTSGTYEVRLIVKDNNDNADTTFQTIQVNEIMADFDIPSGIIYEGCEVAFTNNSTAATSYFWDFGDGSTSTDENPQHVYENPGTYPITLTASDGNNENIDTQMIQIFQADRFEITRDIGGGTNIYRAVTINSVGEYIIAGNTDSQVIGSEDGYVCKVRRDGSVDWEITFGGDNEEFIADIIHAVDGGYVIAGHIEGDDYLSPYLIKVNDSGYIDWEQTFEEDTAYVFSMASTDDAYLLAGAGVSTSSSYNVDAYLMKISSDGSVLWKQTFGGIDPDYIFDIVVSEDYYILVGASYNNTYEPYQAYVIKVRADGSTEWERNFGENIRINSIAISSDGSYVIAGGRQVNGYYTSEVYLAKMDATGTLQWEETFGVGYYSTAYSIENSLDGGYILAGTANYDAYLVKTDLNGTPLFQQTFGGSENDLAYSVKATNDCGYVAVGQIGDFYSTVSPDFYLIKTDSEGNVQ